MSQAWAVPIVAVALSQIAVIATSIYLHQTVAHRALRRHRMADILFRAILGLSTGQCRDDRLDRAVPSRGLLGVGIGLFLLCVVIGFRSGLVAGPIHAVLYVSLLAPLISALGHWHGRQTFETTAYTWGLFAWVSGGESLHNNQHAYPRSTKFSVRRVRVDPSWPAMRALAAMRLLVIGGPLVGWAPGSGARGVPLGRVPTRTAS